MSNSQDQSPYNISFGWDRKSDEQSFKVFIKQFSDPDFLNQLAPRLSDQEITETIDHLSGLMRKHLSEKEYHSLFLSDRDQ